MTELNPKPNPELKLAGTETAAARPGWPVLPGTESAQDPVVGALLERLGALAELPVAGHGEVYAGLHKDLMAALDEAGGSAG